MDYGYGHTKESAALVRQALKDGLAWHIKQYRLKISVRTPGRGHHYGGPRVTITTDHEAFANYYEYIVDAEGNIADSGRLVRVKVADTQGRWDNRMRLVKADEASIDAKATHNKIREILGKFGRDNDDAMTDYFDNTSPLFYGIDYKKGQA